MRIVGGKIYALRIPFVEAFSHHLRERTFSNSIVVQLIASDGTIGFGEGVARPYVTGETAQTSIDHIKNRLFPALEEYIFGDIEPGTGMFDILKPVYENVYDPGPPGEVMWHAAETAVELAVVDCRLKREKLSLAALLPPKKMSVVYSGVITAGTVETAVRHASAFKLFGIKNIKVKIGNLNDIASVAAVRGTIGDDASLRVDANGAFNLPESLEIAQELARFGVEAIEQPLSRGNLAEWSELTARSPTPVMADESLLTIADAEELVARSACNFFNLRVSKLGGMSNTLKIAGLAQRNGIRLQLGCHVGETAILSAVGRHIAAFLDTVEFVEGSFGGLLLAEDVSGTSINFGYGGRAPVLRGTGFGVEVRERVLEKYSHSIIKLSKESVAYA